MANGGLTILLYLVLITVGGWSLAAEASSLCDEHQGLPDTSDYYSTGWGIDQRNTRYQPRSELTAANVDKLTLKWAYGLSSSTPRSYPLVSKDTIFMGDSDRGVIALDRETGCERWIHENDGYISSAILPATIGDRSVVIYADRFDGIYALDARDGQLIWHAAVDDETLPMYSGTPMVAGDRIFVPVASMEVTLAINPFYGCCTSSGGMAAFDITTGEKLWYRPTIEAPATVTGRHFFFVEEYGPSGAPVWSTPSYDAKRDWLFFGTGQNYTHPTTETSDAIFALDAATGEVQWIQQYTENDAYTAACNLSLKHPNCAQPHGPDVDFGAPTLLVTTRSGRELLLAGQKSADAHAMDVQTGERVWTTNLGRGGIIGGVHWGLAVNEKLGLVYVPISDKAAMGFPSPGDPEPGLYALDIETGERRWSYSRQSRCPDEECTFGLSAAITASNDIVVTGNMDGFLEVFHAATGKLLWQHDSWRSYDTVNQVEASGGAFDAHGSMIADDLLMVTSGYRYVGAARGGNAFLVFQLEKDDE